MNILRIQISFPSSPPVCTVRRSKRHKIFTVEMSVNHPELTTMNIERALELYEENQRVIHTLNKSDIEVPSLPPKLELEPGKYRMESR